MMLALGIHVIRREIIAVFQPVGAHLLVNRLAALNLQTDMMVSGTIPYGLLCGSQRHELEQL